ncbi:hypothetical protein HIM_08668 [Hirsutella minnesotensis 3608]|uniref:Heterokaryon incompatibility domain-containing protein n=1 Tax=Hirsutella minnesotensis 3608 TaxID=1043627 RepID=A0A0F7ZY61_9HYPO|nr:hypothetical protein HIM_08668 [Hirsutella minnesotensis 3608]
MDHLPNFRAATRPYSSVPYLGTGHYDGSRFREYASSHGWDVSKLQQGDFVAATNKSPCGAGFLQDWLYFGVLHELFAAAGKKSPQVHLFVQDTARGKTVTSRRLDGLISKSVSSIARLGKKKKEAKLGCLDDALDIASSVVKQLWRLAMGNGQSPLPMETVLSIMILGSSIDKALDDAGLSPAATRRHWNLAEAAKLSMQRSGWCPRDVALTGQFLSEVSMFCASHLQRGPEAQAAHDRCSEVACETRQTDGATYQTKHSSDGCRCDFWRADPDELQGIIRQGRIPYIQLRREGKSVSPTLQSLRDSLVKGPHNRFVVFSHVWSDGLGNPRENALPMCQLERFYDMLCDSPWDDVAGRQMIEGLQAGKYKGRRMENTASFPPKSWRRWGRRTLNTTINIWIDTLCVPIDKEMRKVAIGMLKRYYSFATMTVVLDKELCALQHKQYAESELLLRIGLSGWMSRCWTMQEAIVAGGSLALRFHDGWYSLMDSVAFVRRQSSTIGVNVLSEQQKAKTKHLRRGTKLVCYPLFAAVFLCNSAQVVCNGCTDLVCVHFPRAVWRAIRPKKSIKPSTTSETLLAECKHMFDPISHLCQDASAARPGDPEYAAEAVRRIELSWHGLRHRNTSHAPDRFVNFAFGCAMRDADFDLMKRLLGLPAPDRLRAWLLSQDALPSGLLFLGGPKMEMPGYRWAPTDIHPGVLEPGSPASCVRGKHGGHVPEGSLQLYRPGLLWEQPDTRPLASIWAACELDSDLLHAVELEQGSVQPESLCPLGQGQYGIIFSRPPTPGHGVTGVLLANVARRSDAYTGQFLCRVIVRTRPRNATDPTAVLPVRRLAEHQKWMVS